jgi:ABC-type transport system involved in multi-copper enzyme maturation permease subunit
MDGEISRRVAVNDQIVFWAREDQPATSAFFDIPDTTFVIKLLVSLFALMFSLDVATREKETGTLRAMLAQPVRRLELILSKSLGASISLLAPLAIAYFIETMYLHITHGLLNDWRSVIRVMLIFGLASLYGIVFLHIGLFISTITTRTRIAVTTALLAWVTTVLILPGASVLMAKLITPASSYNQLNARLREARRMILQEKAEANLAEKTARPSRQLLPRIYEIERRETDNYLAGKKNQNDRARLFASLSPTGALTFGASDLAGTGVDAHNSYMELFRSNQDVMIDALNRSIYLSQKDANELLQEAREKVANTERLAEPLGAIFRSSIIPISSLLVWAIFFGMASCWRFERYDVR